MPSLKCTACLPEKPCIEHGGSPTWQKGDYIEKPLWETADEDEDRFTDDRMNYRI